MSQLEWRVLSTGGDLNFKCFLGLIDQRTNLLACRREEDLIEARINPQMIAQSRRFRPLPRADLFLLSPRISKLLLTENTSSRHRITPPILAKTQRASDGFPSKNHFPAQKNTTRRHSTSYCVFVPVARIIHPPQRGRLEPFPAVPRTVFLSLPASSRALETFPLKCYRWRC